MGLRLELLYTETGERKDNVGYVTKKIQADNCRPCGDPRERSAQKLWVVQVCEGFALRRVLTLRVLAVCRGFGETAPNLLAEYSVPPVFQHDLLRLLGKTTTSLLPVRNSPPGASACREEVIPRGSRRCPIPRVDKPICFNAVPVNFLFGVLNTKQRVNVIWYTFVAGHPTFE